MRRGLLLALLCVLSPFAAFAQGIRYDNVAFATGGVRLPNPTVSVSATVYTTAALTTAAANPLPIVAIGQTFAGAGVDAAGNYGFWAAPGRYVLTISSPGITPITMTVTLPCDSTATSCSLGALSASTFDISANTLKTATNTAGHVPRNNGTQYVDSSLAASDLSNGATGSGSVVLASSPAIASPSTTGTDSGAETLTNKTVDISANTLKTATNTAGHYPRNNGTSYVDNTIQSADLPATTSNCAGQNFAQGLNAGGTPICGAAQIPAAQVSAATNFGTNLSTQTVVASVPVTGLVYLTDPIVVTTAGASCSASNNNTTSTWSFTAPGGTVTTVSGGSVSFTGNGTLDGGANPGTAAVQSVVAKAGTAITYTTTSTLGSTGCSPLPQYTVYAKAFF